MPVIVIQDDSRFQPELSNAGPHLAVVDFTATWCGPCQRIAPIFEQLSSKYSEGAVFLKVDVDRCPETAASQSVSAMPTFIFYRNKVKLAKIQGADPDALENKIRELVGSGEGSVEGGGTSADVGVPGHMDLVTLIYKGGCECLNESDDYPLAGCLSSDPSAFLESDCDEQLIINMAFNQNVKLHSIKLKGPADKGAKTVKLFINQPQTLDFDQALSMEPIQEIELSPNDVTSGALIPLRYVKFQNVNNLLIFVKDNQSGGDVTRIDHLVLVGSPVCTTKMSDFKRIAGKKGESH